MTSNLEWHMTAHERAVPHAAQIPGARHRIMLPSDVCNVQTQHNPCVLVIGDALHTLVRVSHERHTTNYFARIRTDSDWGLDDVMYVNNEYKLAGGVYKRGGDLGPSARPAEIEDVRIFHWRDGIWGVAAVHEGGPHPSNIRQGLVEFANDRRAIWSVHIQWGNRVEKNWMPAVYENGTIRFVYSCSPLVIGEINYASHDQHVAWFPTDFPRTREGRVRGSSQLIPWGGGWLALVHQVYKPPRTPPNWNPLLGGFPPLVRDPIAGHEPLVYLHQFVRFDKDLKQVEYAPPFYFNKAGIEFCCGLAFFKDKLVASYGVDEKEAWVIEIEKKQVEGYTWAPNP